MVFGFWDVVTAVWDYLWAVLTGNVDGFLVEQCVGWVKGAIPGI